MNFIKILMFLRKKTRIVNGVLALMLIASAGSASQFQMPNNTSEFNQVMLKMNDSMKLLSSRGLEQKLVQYGYCREIDFIAKHLTPDLIERYMKGTLGLIDRGLINSSGVDVNLLRLSFTTFSNADLTTKYLITRELENVGEENEASIRLEVEKQESDRREMEEQARRAAEEQKRQEMQAAQAAEARARQEESDRRAMEEQARRAAEEQKRQEMQAAQAAEAQRLAQIENDQINQIKGILDLNLADSEAAAKIGSVFKEATDKLALYNKLRINETRERECILLRAYKKFSN